MSIIKIQYILKIFWNSFFMLLPMFIYAQNISETRWYFGNTPQGLIFDPQGIGVQQLEDQAVPLDSSGTITITHQLTGNLLFYSDGLRLYDASHQLVIDSLSGNPKLNTPIVTCPVPGNPDQYYLFTNSGSSPPNEIQFTIIDISLLGNGVASMPLGSPTVVNQSTGLTDPGETMTIIPAGDGEVYWLISQKRDTSARDTSSIIVSRIDEDGINVLSANNFRTVSNPSFEASQFSYNSDSLWLAVAPKDDNVNLWILNFDPMNGSLSFNKSVLNTGFDDGQNQAIFDIEWSDDGSKLYFSRFGGATSVAQLYQIDFGELSPRPQPILTQSIYRSFGLKRALDSSIYHLYQLTKNAPFHLGRINNPNDVFMLIEYDSIVFDVDYQSRQFPEFSLAYDFEFDVLDFHYIDSCATNTTKFFPMVIPTPNRLFWSFGDGTESGAWIANHEYMSEGGYMVRLSAEVNGIIKSVTKPVEIFSNDLMVDLGEDTVICIDEVLTLDAGTGQSFVWNTEEITQTIEVDTAGTYWVEVTNATGCTSFDEIEVREYGNTTQISNQWYFGEQAGIEFTNGPLAILDANQMAALEGCASISDINGELLFYTNGETIWNREHEIMINGDTIGGSQSSTQNSLILPFNGDRTLFYVFTTEHINTSSDLSTLKYSIVDLKGGGAKGEVVVKNIPLMERSTERIAAYGFSGNDIMIVHEFGNNTFRSYQTGPEGLSSPIISYSGMSHSVMNPLDASGYMNISPTSTYLAVLLPESQRLEIFDFEQGLVMEPRSIDVGEENLYGLAFSPSGLKLYMTTSSQSNSKLIQYDLDSLYSMNSTEDIMSTKYDEYTSGSNYGALQIAPDGLIYMAIDNSTIIGTISSPNANDNGASFNSEGFDLEGRSSRLGLPNFSQNETPPGQEPGISVMVGCHGQPTIFSGAGRDSQIENYFWVFGDGQSSMDQNVAHIYDFPGTYTVQLMLSNRCDEDTVLTQTVEIFPIPEPPIVPSDTIICNQPITIAAWPENNDSLSYYWSNGATTREITVREPTIIGVAIINNLSGCSSDTVQIFVARSSPEITLGEDLIFCQNDSSIILDAQISIGTYAWAINGTVLGNNRTFEVSTEQPGVFEYTIAVTNSLGCIGRDTIQVTISEQPNVTIQPMNTSNCNNDNGQIDLIFNTSGNFTYELVGPTPIPLSSTNGLTTEMLTDLAPGNYSITITNLVAGCQFTRIISIEDPTSFDLVANSINACLGEGEITLTFGSTPANFDLLIVNENGNNIVSTTLTTAFANPVAQNLDTGVYYVSVQDRNAPNCLETDTTRIQLLRPLPDINFDAIQEICGTEGTISITDNEGGLPTYSWSGAGIVGNNIGTSIVVNQPGSYIVSSAGPMYCTRTDIIEVIFNTSPMVEIIQQGDPCEGEVTLTTNITNGSGDYLFEWNDGSQSPQHTITTSGVYSVNVTDQRTGCKISSDNINLDIEALFEVLLSSVPDCENNNNAFLIATTNYYDPAITYEWQAGSGIPIEDTDSVIVVNTSGKYRVIANNPTGTCRVEDEFDVSIPVIDKEDLILPERITFCRVNTNDPEATLDPGIWNTYEWRLLPETEIKYNDRIFSTDVEGVYEVSLFNGFTCIKDTVRVNEDCRPIIYAPNSFTPNDDDINDTFFVFSDDLIDTFEIFIYNRWGELIYYSENKDFRWDGFHKGELLPLDTYAYIIKFTSMYSPELGTLSQYGTVNLIR